MHCNELRKKWKCTSVITVNTERKRFMRDFLMVVEIIISILLIVVVVAQTGKSAGMGGAVSGAADSVFGGKERGVDGFLSRCTVVLATLFVLVSLALDLVLSSY